MSIENGDGEKQAHLRDYWRIIWGGRWTIGAVFVIVVAIGILATIVQTPIYRATVVLEISPRTQRVVRVDDISEMGTTGRGWSAEDRYFKTQLEVLKSRDVAERAFKALGLDGHEMFRSARDPVARFMTRIEVEPTPDTLVVAVHVDAPQAKEASDWANAVASAYVDRNIELANQATASAVKSLLDQLEPLRENLTKHEKEMYTYAREEQVYIPETQKASYNERLSALEKDYTATRLKTLSLEAVFRKIEEIDAEGGDYFVIPDVANDQILRDMVREKGEREAELRKLAVTFKPGHFKVKEAEAALDKLEQRIQKATERIISSIRTEYTLAQARQKDLEREIRQTKEEALAITEKASAYDIMRAESENARKIYDMVAERINEVDLNSSLIRNNLTVLDPARVPTAPIRPRRVLNLAVSMLMGIGLGIGLVFFLEYLDNTVRGTDQLETEFGLSTLAVIPRLRPATEEAVAEAFSSLRTGVQFSSMKGARRVLLVTSAGPRDGKTMTALELARTMVRAGDKVCLIDADLRNPEIHELMNVPASPGLTEHFAGESMSGTLTARGAADGEPEVIAAGAVSRSPADVFSSQRFAAMIKDLKGQYDWVVIDSPPAAGLTDAVLLAAHSDMVVFVTRQGSTDLGILKRAIEAVRTANPNIIGTVLNDVDLKRAENRELYYPTYQHRASRKAPSTTTPRRRPAAL